MAKDLIKYSTTQAYTSKARVASQKAVSKLARHYKRYIRPTTKIVRGVGRFARGAGKLALRFPV